MTDSDEADMPAMVPDADDVRARLKAALRAALRERDMIAASAVRSALAALGNAEAVPPDEGAPVRGGGPHYAGSVGGLGAAEAQRRDLSQDEVGRIIRTEIAERVAAAQEYEIGGHGDRAARLRREADVLSDAIAGH